LTAVFLFLGLFSLTGLQLASAAPVCSTSYGLVRAAELGVLSADLAAPQGCGTGMATHDWTAGAASSTGLTSVADAGDFACGLTFSGRAECWGELRFDWGYAAAPLDHFTQLARGEDFVCGLEVSAQAVCWGKGAGQLSAPSDRFVQLAAGTDSACGLESTGYAVCWGTSNNGESSPPPDQFTQITVGGSFACGLESSGHAVCWGGNGQVESSTPSDQFIQLSAGGSFVCGLEVSAQAVCWGSVGPGWSEGYQLSQIRAGGTNDLVGQNRFACGLSAAGQTPARAFCWGNDDYGQQYVVPEDVFTALSAGFDSVCGLEPSGQPLCWGGDFGMGYPWPALTGLSVGGYECGLDTSGHDLMSNDVCWGPIDLAFRGQNLLFLPVNDSVGEPAFAQLTSGRGFVCGRVPSGPTQCWGHNPLGGLQPPGSARFIEIAAGYYYVCGIKTSGRVLCWGAVSGTPDARARFTHLSAYGYDTCGLEKSGRAVCWGADSTSPASNRRFSQITNGCGLAISGRALCWAPHLHSPPAFDRFKDIAAGTAFGCGLTSSGRTVCWGRDTDGVTSPPPNRFTQIAANGYDVCGLTKLGQAECWGGWQSPPFD
jgi:Regulator of chromosome condensation (RCC1) repeat